MATDKRNRSLAINLLMIVAGMIMLAYASVPLYKVFCQTTGFGGVAQATKAAPGKVLNRTVTVRFDANINPELPWEFKPDLGQVDVKLGEEKVIQYHAKNMSAKTTKGTATFNVLPVKAGKYFDKVQCFCFSEQTLKPNEQKQLGVQFFIDPAMQNDPDLDDVHTITLSYTFFSVKK